MGIAGGNNNHNNKYGFCRCGDRYCRGTLMRKKNIAVLQDTLKIFEQGFLR